VTYQFDTTGNTQLQIDDLATRILYDMARREEYLQGQDWAGKRWTSAALEDISSDMVGAMVGRELAKDPTLTRPKALVAVLNKCIPIPKVDAKTVFENNEETATSGINWTAVPPKMAKDPCAKMKAAPYPDFNFTDTKKFPATLPTTGVPPRPFK
jgi:hypothetical protein